MTRVLLLPRRVRRRVLVGRVLFRLWPRIVILRCLGGCLALARVPEGTGDSAGFQRGTVIGRLIETGPAPPAVVLPPSVTTCCGAQLRTAVIAARWRRIRGVRS